jgi:magnesium chelatase family protein
MARAHAIAVTGAEGHVVAIEASIGSGPPGMVLRGLPDASTAETRDRVRAAVINSGLPWPPGRVTVTLSPASLAKRDAGFDLGIAVAVLAAAGTVRPAALDRTAFIGEAGLDGQVRAVPGVLPAVIAATRAGLTQVVTAPPSLPEAALVPGVRVIAPARLSDLAGWLNHATSTGHAAVRTTSHQPGGALTGLAGRDLAGLAISPAAREAAEVSAAGGHHLLVTGPAGSDRALLAGHIAAIMPPLGPAEALEVTAIHSVAGLLDPAAPLITAPPLRAPHHTASKAAIAGGGSGLIRPGEASLAHLGVLFLNDAPEFGRDVLDALRQPLETGAVSIARAGLTASFPARFILVLGASPCPCARTAAAGTACTCPPAARRRYLARLSGPLLDRADLTVDLAPAGRAELLSDHRLAGSGAVAAGRVAAARERAAARLAGTAWRLNAHVPAAELRRSFRPAAGALAPLERAVDLGEVSVRAANRIVAMAWTLADLAGSGRPGRDEISQALELRRGGGR